MNFIPYGKQTINQDDIDSVLNVLKDNNYLTTGPKINEFEQKVSAFTNIKYAVAVSNGTTALHCALHASGIKEGDEVIVTTISFLASANAILYCNAKPVFCDVNENTLNIDENKIEELITEKTKAIIAVDFAGQLCNYKKINKIAKKYNLIVVQDAAHSFGIIKNSLADLTTFSFHPVKNITTCEGGMIMTNNENMANKMKQFRNHGMDIDYKNRYLHYYNMTDIGYNYRLTDLQCALGISQMNRIDQFIERRQEIAKMYTNYIVNSNLINYIKPLDLINNNAFHIYVIKILKHNRDDVYQKLLEKNIGVNVHYKPIHLQPYYIENVGTHKGLCPISEKVYEQILTLPIYPLLEDGYVEYILSSLEEILF